MHYAHSFCGGRIWLHQSGKPTSWLHHQAMATLRIEGLLRDATELEVVEDATDPVEQEMVPLLSRKHC